MLYLHMMMNFNSNNNNREYHDFKLFSILVLFAIVAMHPILKFHQSSISNISFITNIIYNTYITHIITSVQWRVEAKQILNSYVSSAEASCVYVCMLSSENLLIGWLTIWIVPAYFFTFQFENCQYVCYSKMKRKTVLLYESREAKIMKQNECSVAGKKNMGFFSKSKENSESYDENIVCNLYHTLLNTLLRSSSSSFAHCQISF